MTTHHRADVAVIGAGPAGLAAATTAARAGLAVALVDVGSRPGGQYWRHRAAARPSDRRYAALEAALAQHADRIDHLAGWQVALALPGPPAVAHLTDVDDAAATLTADAVVLATGAHDRALLFPGWDLPGVLTAGGAQALVKGQGVVPGRRAVVAGTGPFLLPVAATLAQAGVEVAAVVEAAPATAWPRRPAAVLAGAGKLAEAVGYAAVLARHRIPYRTGRAVVAAHGADALQAVTVARIDADWQRQPGGEERIDCDVLATGYGFTPQLELPLALGCSTELDPSGALVVAVDKRQRTSVPHVWAAGEITGVGGADLALVEGELAGHAVAQAALGAHPDAADRPRLLARRRRLRRFADALAEVHRIGDGWPTWSDRATLVCRCEEVPLGALHDAVAELDAADPRTVKLLTRTGMGWCQGRICGWPTAAITARACGRTPTAEDLRGMAHRPFAVPLTLGAIAALADPPDPTTDRMTEPTIPEEGP